MQLKMLPLVSIIVPCYNEEGTIALMLDAIKVQSYPISNIEVVIADALSEDNSRAVISQFVKNNPEISIRIVDNVKQTIPAAVNIAAKAASGEYLIRLDAHSIPNKDYVQLIVKHLHSGTAENVGGVWDIRPGNATCIAKAIAAAASHLIGAGDALYRITKKAAFVDTVPFGAFRKSKFFELGGLDENLLSNEDYEFNTRLRMKGGKIWLDPEIRCQYFARSTLRQLARQYWRYGFWKFQMLKRFPRSIRWRQVVPPIFVAINLILCATSFFSRIPLIILYLLLTLYLSILFAAGFLVAIRKRNICYLLMPFAFITMHFSWGSGFILSLIKGNY